MNYVLDHFGTKEPFKSMPKIRVKVGILMHKVVRSSIKELHSFLPEPNFKQIYLAPHMFLLQKFVKNGYRFGHFPFEFIYVKPSG
jgi:hypothetical protein